MARNILIDPQRTGTDNPNIQFSGSLGNTIRLEVLSEGSVQFTGVSGSLLKIMDFQTGGSQLSSLFVSGTAALTGSFIPGVTSLYDLGSSTNKWRTVFANSFSGSLTKLSTGADYLVAGAGISLTTGSNGSITITNDGTVGDITAVTAGTGLTGGGTSGAVTLAINDGVVATVSGTTFSGAVKFNSGLSGSLTKLIDGTTNYIQAGSNISISTGSNGSITVSAPNLAPSTSAFVTIGNDSTLTSERSLAAGAGLNLTDGGANSSVTLSINDGVVATVSGSTFAGSVKFNAGLSGSLTKLSDGTTNYLQAGSNVTISTGSNGQVTIASSSPAGTVTGTGTTNYVPKWTSTNVIGNSLIYDDGTYVGVNNTSPSATLHVGNNDSATLLVNGASKLLFRDSGTYMQELSGLQIESGTGRAIALRTSNTERVRIDTGGNVGIGTSTYGSRLYVSGSISATTPTATIREGVVASTTAVGVLDVQSYTGSSLLFVSGSGFVGVGTNIPSSPVVPVAGGKFQVSSSNTGNAAFGLFIGSQFFGASLNYYDAYNHIFRHSDGSTIKVLLDGNGNVGIGSMSSIGVSNPLARLFVSGSSTSAASGLIVKAGIASPVGAVFEAQGNGGTSLLVVSGSGNVGIGISNTGDKLAVNGSLSVTGSALPGATSTYDLGSTAKIWRNVYSAAFSGSLTKLTDGTSYLIAGSNVTVVTGTNGAVTISAPNLASSASAFVTIGNDSTLSNERALAAGTGLTLTDGGANSNVTLAINDSVVATISGSTFTGAVKFNAGLSGSLTKLTDGTSYLVAGSNVTITTGSSGQITIETSSPAGTVSGTGTANFLTKWIGSSTIGDSILSSVGSEVGVTGSILPGSDNAYNLGSSLKRWNSIYAANISGSLTGSNLTAGQVVVVGTGGLLSGSNNFWWENSTGRVGIGTTNPAATLQVLGHTTAGAASAAIIREGVASQTGGLPILDVQRSTGTSILFVSGSGNVGIGTNVPTSYISSNSTVLAIAHTGNVATVRASSGPGLASGNQVEFYAGASQVGIWGSTNVPMVFHTNASERVRIEASGNVGIGTAFPAINNRLDVVGGALRVNEDGVGTHTLQLRSNWAGTGAAAIQVQTNTPLAFIVNAAERARIDTSGNFGIGTNAPAARLHVTGSSTSSDQTALIRGGVPSQLGPVLEVEDYLGNTLLVVSGSGNVGVGTTAMDSRLVVNGNSVFSGSVNPDADLTRDLGSSTKRWNNLYAVNISGSLTGSNVTAGQVVVAGTGGVLSGSNNLFWDNSTTRLGIGTNSPISALTVNGPSGVPTANPPALQTLHGNDTSVFRLKLTSLNFNVNGNWLGLGIGYHNNYMKAALIAEAKDGFGRANMHLALNNAATTANVGLADARLTVTFGGNVGIGGTNPTARFEVTGSGATSSTSTAHFVNSSGTSLLFVRDDGNVGIGTSSPTVGFRLDVRGAGRIAAADPRIDLVGTYRGFMAQVVDAGSAAASYWRLYDLTAGANRVIVDSSGNVGIGTVGLDSRLVVAGTGVFSGSVNPSADAIYDLGTATKRWRNVYATSISGSITGSNLTAGQVVVAGTGGVLSGTGNFTYDNSTGNMTISGSLRSVYSAGDEGGEIFFNKPQTNTSINTGVTIDMYQNRIRIFETGGTNRGGYFDITALGAGVATNLVGGTTANYWFESAVNTIYSTGSVGVGTNSYAARFFVTGSSTASTPTMIVREGVSSPAGGVGVLNVQNSAGTSILFVTGSGNVGVGNTTPSYAMDVVGQVKTRLQTSGNATGIIIGNNGSEQPHIQFTASDNSARFKMQVNSVNAASERLSFYAGPLGGVATNEAVIVGGNGNVGIGTGTQATSRLLVTGSGATSSTSTLHLVNSSGTSLLFVNDAGTVGIGTSSPDTAAPLTVDTAFNTHVVLRGSGNTQRQAIIASNSGVSSNYNGLALYSNTNASFSQANTALSSWRTILGNFDITADRFAVSRMAAGGASFSEFLTILSSGNVGVGTTNPAGLLTVSGTIVTKYNTGLESYIAAGTYSAGTTGFYPVYSTTFGGNDTVVKYGAGGNSFVMFHGSTVVMTANSSENVSIGTNSYAGRLFVSGSSTASTPTMVVREGVAVPAGGVGTFDVQNSAGTSLLFVSGSGNVGIGTTAPSTSLAVYNSSMPSISLGNSSNYTKLSTSGNDFYVDAGQGTAGGGATIFRRGSGTAEHVRFDASGNVGIGTSLMDVKLVVNGNSVISGTLNPSTNNTYSLGTTAKSWSNVVSTAFSGSLTKLSDGSTNYLQAGSNVTITTGSNGAVTIASSSPAGTVSGTGTTNYVAKFTATSTVGNSLIYDDGTNVGIGSTSPGYKLDVNGDVNLASTKIVRVNGTAVLNTQGSNGSDIYVNARVVRNESSVNTDGLYLGYGNSGTTTGHIRFFANGTNERMKIAADTGSVIISDLAGSVSTSTARLLVSGSSTSTTPTMVVKEGVASATGGAGILSVQNSSGTSLLFVSGSGFVGIGTNTQTPAGNAAGSILYVSSSLAGNAHSSLVIGAQFLGVSINTYKAFTQVFLLPDGTETMRIDLNGNVGIGTASTNGNKLSVNGEAAVTGSITPGVDNTYSLGSSTKRWTNVYSVSGSASSFTTTPVSTGSTWSRTFSSGESGRITATVSIAAAASKTFTVSANNGASLFDVGFVVSESGFSVARKYTVAAQYGTSTSNVVSFKTIDTGPYSGNDLTVTFTKSTATLTTCTISHNNASTTNVALTIDISAISSGGAPITVTIF